MHTFRTQERLCQLEGEKL